MIEIVTRTIEEKGIELPWERRERLGPNTQLLATSEARQRPPKGTVLETGTVFIPLKTLDELGEQDVFDSQFGSVFLLGYHEGLALEQAGLADRETKGGFHRTDKLLEFLRKADRR